MEEMEHPMESQQKPEGEPVTSESMPEPLCISGTAPHHKPQRADDVALTQCILCMVLVLCVFALHWLKPEWQTLLLEQYASHRDAPPIQWLDALLQAAKQWMQQ